MPELIAGQIAWAGCWAHYTAPHMGSKQCHHNHYRNWQLELTTGLCENIIMAFSMYVESS